MSSSQEIRNGGIGISLNASYSLTHGPWQLLPHASQIAEQTGIPLGEQLMNCQLFLHQIYRLHFIPIPQMWSSEIAQDESYYFRTIASTRTQFKRAQQFMGDIYMFEPMPRQADSDFDSEDERNLHLAIGASFKNGIPHLIHANRWDGKVSIWPLNKFFQPVSKYDNNDPPKRRYRRLVKIKRLMPDYWDIG
ncbi:MAG: hypothetical protein Q7R95_06420, partial [bacterium]|nr:hypothetical protein [bacterium]